MTTPVPFKIGIAFVSPRILPATILVSSAATLGIPVTCKIIVSLSPYLFQEGRTGVNIRKVSLKTLREFR